MVLKDHISVEMHKLGAMIGEENYTNLYIYLFSTYMLYNALLKLIFYDMISIQHAATLAPNPAFGCLQVL